MHSQEDKPINPEREAKAKAAKFWLDDRGIPLPLPILLIRAKQWTAEEWEACLEDVEVPLREDLGQSKDRRLLRDEFETSEHGLDTSEHSPLEYEYPSGLTDSARSLTAIIRPPRRTKAGDGETSEEIDPTDEKAAALVAEIRAEDTSWISTSASKSISITDHSNRSRQ